MTDDSQPEVEDWFWDLIESSGRSLRTLARKLEQLPKEQLRQYRLQYDEAKDWVSPHSAEEFWPYVTDCSEDWADDFAAWVVGRGREFFDQVRSNPEAVQQHLDVFEAVTMGKGAAGVEWDTEVDRDDYRGYQRPDAIVIPIYEAKFGEDLLDACYDQRGHPRSEAEVAAMGANSATQSPRYASNLGLQSPAHHKAILDADPENVEARLDYAHALLETDSLEEAAAILHTVLDQPNATRSQLGNARLFLGKITMDLGRVDEAIEHFREALVLRPTHPSVLLDLARLLNFKGERTEARALWQRVLDAWPNGGPQYQIEECRRLLEQYPDVPDSPQLEGG